MSADPQSHPTIMAVDDAPETLSLLSDVLENAGMTTLVVRSGTSALSLLAQVKPDIILMDAVMPKMDGFETCRRIKAMREFAHIPVIFMTGLSDTEHVVMGFESGGVDYITKPIVPNELLARIRVHLANSRLTQSARIALDRSGTPLVAADETGHIIWITPEASKLLGSGTEDQRTNDSQWRAGMVPFLARIIAQKQDKATLETAAGLSLTATFIGEAGPGEYLIGFNDGSSATEEDVLRERFELTGREAEVLRWIAQGKSNRDIGAILTCSPRTVNKHLEQIYQKLQVENRTAAATLALRAMARS